MRNKKKLISKAIKNVDEEIAGLASHGHTAAGLSSEGYAGGYRDALYDMINLLNGVFPQRRYWWD